MEDKQLEVFQSVSPSVVIVSVPEAFESSNYCIGFVVVATEGAAFVITQSSIITSAKGQPTVHLSINGKHEELKASVQVIGPIFCLLRTDHHASLKAVKFVEGDVTPPLTSDVLTLAPALHYQFYSIPGTIILDSCEATGPCIHDYIIGSEREFLASCDYSEMSNHGKSRLVSAPVFDMEAEALGIVTGDYGFVARDGRRSGFEIKTVLLPKHVDEVLLELVQDKNCPDKEGDKDWRKHLHSLSLEPEREKRKRGAKASKGA